jgi:hypothetical protein
MNPAHEHNAETAKRLYLAKSTPADDRADWLSALRDARQLVADALRVSNFLFDIELSLTINAQHCLVFRHMVAPPKSQDQFKLLCPAYSKSCENKGSGLKARVAQEVATLIIERMDPSIGKWLRHKRPPQRREIEEVFHRVSPIIAAQMAATARRNRLAFEQESAVMSLLIANGWTKLPSRLIDTRAQVNEKHFMHKTRFATSTVAHQEVDIACGLAGTFVLAMECKVTNDETNSVKRINDVLKKHSAWKSHWGSFVETAALLEGVIAPKDVQRLEDNGVRIFWSHDLNEFSSWLSTRL